MARHLPQRPARPGAAGHLLGRARAACCARAWRRGWSCSRAWRSPAARRASSPRCASTSSSSTSATSCARTASGCRGRRNIRCGELLRPTPAMLASGRYSLGDFVVRGPLQADACRCSRSIYPMIALVTLLAGGYRRSGFGRRVVVAVGVAALLAGADVRAARPGAGAAGALAADVPAGALGARLRRRCCSCGSAGAPGGCRHDARPLHPARLPARARRGLRGDRARHRALHLGREPAPLRRVGRRRRRHPADHPAAGARGALPGVSAGADAREPRHLPAASRAPASSW